MTAGAAVGGGPTRQEWKALGRHQILCGYRIFTIDLPPSEDEVEEPLLVIHGYPSCSFDYRLVVSELRRHRRVMLLDLPGFGFSEKPDIRYSIELHADVTAAFMSAAGVTSLALLTHDMGDTVGGELLARQAEGSWQVEVTRRVVTNGSVYIELARLTPGQRLLLSLPDAVLEHGPGHDDLAAALAETMAEGSTRARKLVGEDADLVCEGGGNRLLARTIRYIEDRVRAEARYTGAIESHRSALGIVWGADDPIAVAQMTDRLKERRADARVDLLGGVGHYPMLESPDEFVRAAANTL